MKQLRSVLIGCGHLIRNIRDFQHLFQDVGLTPTVPNLNGQQFSESEMLKLLPGHTTAIIGDDQITRKVLEAASPDLKALIKWGIGTDNIDLCSARAMQIPVYNTPGHFSGEVADLAIGMMLTLARQINTIDKQVREGNWLRLEGESIEGSSAHIIGMGNIGQSIAKRLIAFDVKVTGSDPRPLKLSKRFKNVDMNSTIAEVDWVFLACELNQENFKLVNDSLISKMKKGVRIINVARGLLVDETALIKHLASGHVSGVGLDVFEQEPLSPNNPLASFPNVVLGNHGGSSTRQAIKRVNELTVKMAIEILFDKFDAEQYNQVN